MRTASQQIIDKGVLQKGLLALTLVFLVVLNTAHPLMIQASSEKVEILFPRCGAPIIQKKGEMFTIKIDASDQAHNWMVEILASNVSAELLVKSCLYDIRAEFWVLKTVIPLTAKDLLYNLTIQVEIGGVYLVDTEPRAVQVVSEFSDTFYFIQINDCLVEASMPPADSAIRRAIREINIIRPMFLLFTGDLVHHGYEEEYKNFYELLQEFRVPTYVCPGNHEFDDGVLLGEARYQRYLAPLNHSFDYASYHFISINTGSDGSIGSEQLEWVRNDLEEHRDSKLIFVQMHHPMFTREGRASRRVKERGELMELFDKYGVSMVLTGHEHYDSVERANRTIYVITTASGAECRLDGYWGYRLIYIDGGKIVSYTWNGSNYLSIPLGRPERCLQQEPELSVELTKNKAHSLITQVKGLIEKAKGEGIEGLEEAEVTLEKATGSYEEGRYEDAKFEAIQAENLAKSAFPHLPVETILVITVVIAVTAIIYAVFLLRKKEEQHLMSPFPYLTHQKKKETHAKVPLMKTELHFFSINCFSIGL